MMKMHSLALVAVALIGGIAAWYFFGKLFFINFEAGYSSAILVLAATTFSYWRLIKREGEQNVYSGLPDETECIDDRFGLWEEEPTKNLEDASKLLKEQKRRIKSGSRDFKSFLKTSGPAFSLYRLGAYALLVYIVFELMSAKSFEPVAFLAGVAAAPVTVASVFWIRGRC